MILSDNVEISFTDRKRIAHAYGKTGRFLLATSNFFFINFTFAGRSLVIKLLRKTAKSSFLTLHYYEYYVYHRQDIHKLNCDRQLNTSYFRLSIIMNHLLLALCFMTSVVSTTLYCPQESHPKCTGTTPTRSNNPAALVQPPAYITGMKTHHNRGKFSQMRFVKFQSNCYRRYQNKHRPYYLQLFLSFVK